MENTSKESEREAYTFAELGLNEWLVSQCTAVGMVKPTPIQRNCVPKIIKGKDCIGCAKTGSGKTAAFALPILQTLCEDPYGIFALVITPTRELAFQSAEQFQVLGKPIGLKVVVITGGRGTFTSYQCSVYSWLPWFC
ncbi:putative ATP-dependent RNA helicase DDX49 [Lamellibrachia satsuma]|nr:putative ATP-dependent RNA helicase DDX49 [Lamellibrachia satsuma]